MKNDDMTVEYLKVENYMLRRRLLELTKGDPNSYKPPKFWVGADPESISSPQWDSYTLHLNLMATAYASLTDEGHHLIAKAYVKSEDDLQYGFSYFLSNQALATVKDDQIFNMAGQIYKEMLGIFARGIAERSLKKAGLLSTTTNR